MDMHKHLHACTRWTFGQRSRTGSLVRALKGSTTRNGCSGPTMCVHQSQVLIDVYSLRLHARRSSSGSFPTDRQTLHTANASTRHSRTQPSPSRSPSRTRRWACWAPSSAPWCGRHQSAQFEFYARSLPVAPAACGAAAAVAGYHAHLARRPPLCSIAICSKSMLASAPCFSCLQVGDNIEIVFSNNCTFPASIHAHGVRYRKGSEGAPYADNSSASAMRDDAVQPGAQHTFRWEVPERAGPAAGDASSTIWMYHRCVHRSHASSCGACRLMTSSEGTTRVLSPRLVTIWQLRSLVRPLYRVFRPRLHPFDCAPHA